MRPESVALLAALAPEALDAADYEGSPCMHPGTIVTRGVCFHGGAYHGQLMSAQWRRRGVPLPLRTRSCTSVGVCLIVHTTNDGQTDLNVVQSLVWARPRAHRTHAAAPPLQQLQSQRRRARAAAARLGGRPALDCGGAPPKRRRARRLGRCRGRMGCKRRRRVECGRVRSRWAGWQGGQRGN